MATQTKCTGTKISGEESGEEEYTIPPFIPLVNKDPSKSTKRKASGQEVQVAKTGDELMRQVKNLEKLQTQMSQNVVFMKDAWKILIVCSSTDSSEPSKIGAVPMEDFLVLAEYENLAKAGATTVTSGIDEIETSLSFSDDMWFSEDGKFVQPTLSSIDDYFSSVNCPITDPYFSSSPYKSCYGIETLKTPQSNFVRSDVTVQPGHCHADMSGMPGISPHIHISFLEAMMRCNVEIEHDDYVLNKNAKSASKMQFAKKALASSAAQFKEVHSERLPVNDVRFVYIR